MKARANISYDLLSEFKTVPGLRYGKIDAQMLSEWVATARILATAKGLNDISDQRIGYISLLRRRMPASHSGHHQRCAK